MWLSDAGVYVPVIVREILAHPEYNIPPITGVALGGECALRSVAAADEHHRRRLPRRRRAVHQCCQPHARVLVRRGFVFVFMFVGGLTAMQGSDVL